jgi:hypothetical protein
MSAVLACFIGTRLLELLVEKVTKVARPARPLPGLGTLGEIGSAPLGRAPDNPLEPAGDNVLNVPAPRSHMPRTIDSLPPWNALKGSWACEGTHTKAWGDPGPVKATLQVEPTLDGMDQLWTYNDENLATGGTYGYKGPTWFDADRGVFMRTQLDGQGAIVASTKGWENGELEWVGKIATDAELIEYRERFMLEGANALKTSLQLRGRGAEAWDDVLSLACQRVPSSVPSK